MKNLSDPKLCSACACVYTVYNTSFNMSFSFSSWSFCWPFFNNCANESLSQCFKPIYILQYIVSILHLYIDQFYLTIRTSKHDRLVLLFLLLLWGPWIALVCFSHRLLNSNFSKQRFLWSVHLVTYFLCTCKLCSSVLCVLLLQRVCVCERGNRGHNNTLSW